MGQDLLYLLQSSKVSVATRKVFTDRLQAAQDTSIYQPSLLSPAAFATLQQVIARLLLEDVTPDPDEDTQEGGFEAITPVPSLQIAAHLEKARAEGKGNGWRYGSLPADDKALGRGLALLEETSAAEWQTAFTALSAEQQDRLLGRIHRGEVEWAGFDAVRWFEEILADATELYLSNPQTMMRLGYDGFADDPDGWSDIGLNNKQAWEPDAPLPATGSDGKRR